MQTVGELLRNEREKKGYSIKAIENAISIRSLYINAIEEGNYNLIPGEVYLKGFIRNYANYLGLNGKEMVDLYRQSQAPVPPITAAQPSVETPAKTTPNPSNRNTYSTRWLMISLLSVCVAGLAWWMLSSPKSPTEPPLSSQMQTNQSTPTNPPTTQSVVPAAPAQNKSVIITAKYTDQCWTSVTTDGKIIYEGTPLTGDTITWEAQNSITITAGNAGGIDITSNGQSAGKLGAKGEVVVKTFVAK